MIRYTWDPSDYENAPGFRGPFRPVHCPAPTPRSLKIGRNLVYAALFLISGGCSFAICAGIWAVVQVISGATL